MTTPAQARAALRAALPVTAPTAHPSDEELVAYQRNGLGSEAEGRVADHLVACAACADRLLLFAEFDAPEAQAALSEHELAAAWRAVKPAPPVASREAGRGWQAVAASLLVATLGTGYYALQLRSELAASQAPEANTPVVDLFATGPRSGAPRADAVTVPAAAPRATLVLNPERRESFPEYAVEVHTATGELIWQSPGLTKNPFGSFTLSLPRRVLLRAPLDLTLVGHGDTGREVLGRYRLELAPPSPPAPPSSGDGR